MAQILGLRTGGDYESTALDTVVLPTFTKGWYRWDVTERVQSWLAGTPNYGFLIRAPSGQVDKIEFASMRPSQREPPSATDFRARV